MRSESRIRLWYLKELETVEQVARRSVPCREAVNDASQRRHGLGSVDTSDTRPTQRAYGRRP